MRVRAKTVTKNLCMRTTYHQRSGSGGRMHFAKSALLYSANGGTLAIVKGHGWEINMFLLLMSLLTAQAEEAKTRHTTYGFGASVGGTYWLPGSNNGWSATDCFYFEFAGSPTLSATRERMDKRVRPTIGFSSSPTYVTWAWDVGLVSLAMFELGVGFGDEAFSFGPIGTIGLLSAGGGVRARWEMKDVGGHGRSGIETRLLWLYPHAIQPTVMWSWRPGVR